MVKNYNRFENAIGFSYWWKKERIEEKIETNYRF